MNTNKKSLATSNGWILCPSKSFSGKLYYFNVQTGEAVWSLGDNEKFILRKENKQHVQKINSYHDYPEPTTPPDYSPDVTPANVYPSTSTTCPDYNRTSYQKNCTHHANQPMFGQPARFVPQLAPFMPSLPNIGMPNVVWTPIQLPAHSWPYHSPEDKKPTVDRKTQTSQLDRELFVQASGKPLSQRFINYEIPSLTFDVKNKIINKSNSFVSSTPIKDSNSKIEHVQNQVPISKFIPEPILNMEYESQSPKFTDSFIEQSTLDSSNETEIPKDTSSFDTPLNCNEEKPPLTYCNKVQNSNLETLESSKKDINMLHSSDLRFLLMAKRKKLEEETMEQVAIKKPKLQVTQVPLKKKVTFNLENLSDITIDESEQQFIASTVHSKNSFFKTPMSPTQTMLNYYNMLDNKTPMKNDFKSPLRSNMPIRNIPEENPKKYTAANKYVQNCSASNNMPNNDLTYDMSIKKQIVNYALTDNMQNEETLHTPKYVQIKEGIQNHYKNCMPILKEAAMPNSLKESTNCNTILKETSESTLNCDKPIKEGANCEFTLKEMSKSMSLCNKSIKESANSESVIEETTKSMPLCNKPIKESANSESVIKEVTGSYTIKDVWYLVADTDVLLDDPGLIDQLLQSDDKCRLLIPHRIRRDIDALCIGDCRGQQRVLVARQISRRMAGPQKQYVVIPPKEDDSTMSTTDAILNICTLYIKDHYNVILITNDAHLQSKAKELNIRSYKPQEIKNGVRIRPRLFSELKKIKVIIDNDNNSIDQNNVAIKNNTSGLFCDNEKSIPVDMYKKQLFCNDKRTDKNCDILFNITKPKNNTIYTKFDNNIIFKINNHEEKLNFTHLTQNFENQTQNDDTIETDNFEIDNQQNQNMDMSNVYNLKNLCQNLREVVPISKSDTITTQNSLIKNCDYFQNPNFQITNMAIDSTPVYNTTGENDKQNDPSSNLFYKEHEQEKSTVTTKYIEKIITTVNPRTLKINSQSFEKFKIPKLLPLKRKPNTTTVKQSSNATENMHSNFKNSFLSLEGRLKNFYVKSKMMHEKIESRMHEWTCTYTQIMEDLLNDILQANPEFKKMNISATNLHESLTCIKMLYDNDELRNIVEVLVEMLDRCSCSKGKIKLDTTPKDFMKIIGCGVLLVEALKSVLPTAEILTDYGSYLDGLLANIESKAIELDPEPLRSNIDYRSDIDDTKESRQNFLKDPTYIMDYLKKHYKEWSSYDESQDVNQHSPNDDFTVVRMFGKNLNRVKIDNNKSITYARSSIDNEVPKQDATKIVRLSQNNNEKENTHHSQVKETGIILKNLFQIKDKETIKENAAPKIIRLIENVNRNAESKMIRNINKEEPLDLDLLDYEISVTTDQVSIKSNDNIDYSKKIMENNNSIIQNTNKSNENSENFQKDDSFNTNKSIFISQVDICNQYHDVTNENNSGPEIGNENYESPEINYSSNENDNNESEIDTINNENYAVNNNNYGTSNDNYATDPVLPRDDSTNDSGFENECTQAHSIVKLFLIELSNTFKVIYEFVTNFVKEIRGEVMCEERKNHLHIKSSRSLQDMVGVVQQLRSIIKRESREKTALKSLLRRAGAEVKSDSRMSRYRQVIRKCLEQAQILENALRAIVCITIGDLDAISTNADSISSGVKYINIFE